MNPDLYVQINAETISHLLENGLLKSFIKHEHQEMRICCFSLFSSKNDKNLHIYLFVQIVLEPRVGAADEVYPLQISTSVKKMKIFIVTQHKEKQQILTVEKVEQSQL